MTNSFKNILALFFAMAVLGLSLSVQFKAQNSPDRELYQQRQENLIVMVKNLTEKRQRLGQEMSDLSSQLYDRRNAYEDEALTIKSLEQQLNRLDIANGTAPVVGQGLEVQFQVTSPVTYADLVVLVNELWAAGAEAIAVGGYRLNANSYIFYLDQPSGRKITINNNPLTPPIKIQALGEAGSLERGLTLPGGFMDMMMYNKIYPTLRQKESIELPAVASPPLYYYLNTATTTNSNSTTAGNGSSGASPS